VRATEDIVAQMKARIDDMKDRVEAQEKLIQHLLGRPEQVPTRDNLVEALATARERLAAQDREKLELRNLTSALQEQIEFLSAEARSLHGVIKKLIEKLPDEVLRSVPDDPQPLEPMVATQPPSAPDEDPS
jgi:chromosome segregation ATPase